MSLKDRQDDTLKLTGLEESLLRLLKADAPVVVAVSGKWGEGKTHFWKNLAKKHQFLTQSGYITVFGAESLNEIREKIVFAAFKNPGWIQWLTSTWIFQLPLKLARTTYARRLWNFLCDKCTPVALFLSWLAQAIRNIFIRWPIYFRAFLQPSALHIQILEDSFLKEGWLICIDDVERLPKSIEIEQLMGLIAQLRDTRKLKVVLIYNDEKLGNKSDTFKYLSEKVIDRRLPYSPSTEDVVDLVFGKKYSKHVPELTRRCQLIGMRNIRLLHKVKDYFEEFISVLPAPPEEEIVSDKLYMILLYVWLEHTDEGGAWITLNILKNFEEYSFSLSDKIKKGDEHASKLLEFTEKYGYSHTDELDAQLMDFISTDILDAKNTLDIYSKMAGEKDSHEQEEKLSQVWKKLFHSTLTDNSEEFSGELYNAAINNIARLSINSLDTILTTLDDLGEPSKATDLFNKFIGYHNGTISVEAFDFLMSPIKDHRVKHYEQTIRARAVLDDRTLEEVLDQVIEQDHVSERDRNRLQSFNISDFVSHFSHQNKPFLTSIMRKLKKLGVHQISSAAKEIASTSKINRKRMIAMGLVSEESSESAE